MTTDALKNAVITKLNKLFGNDVCHVHVRDRNTTNTNSNVDNIDTGLSKFRVVIFYTVNGDIYDCEAHIIPPTVGALGSYSINTNNKSVNKVSFKYNSSNGQFIF